MFKRIILTLLLSACYSLGFAADCNASHCIIVIDAGSSGSRIHLYGYDKDETNTPINIKEYHSNKITPGISNLTKDSSNAYFNKLFDGVELDKVTPVYLNATAGMRLLSPSIQTSIYNNIKKWFDDKALYDLKEAQTINGQQEGLYGWLAVNYHLKRLKDPQQQTVGVMDMGGASIQITFPVKQTLGIAHNNLKFFNLYGKRFIIFDNSFLGLGMTETIHQFLNQSDCFSKFYPLPSGKKGTGKASSCARQVTQLVNKVHAVKPLIQKALKNNRVNEWYAMGGISSILNFSKLFNFPDGKLKSIELLKQGSSNVCNKAWQEVSKTYPNNPYLYAYCIIPAYYHAIINDGYGIKKTISVLPSDGMSDWTLGVVLLKG